MTRKVDKRAKDFPPVDPRGYRFGLDFFLDGQQQFANPEQTHDGNHKAYPFHQFVDAHRKPHATGDRVDADGSDGKAGGDRDYGLRRRSASHTDKARKGEKIDGEIFRRPKRESHLGDPGGEKRDQHNADKRAEGRRSERSRQRRGRSAVARHRIAVEGRRNRGRLSGNVEQNRSDGAAEQRAPVHAGQKDDRRNWLHAKRQWQEQRNPIRSAEARQYANQDAE